MTAVYCLHSVYFSSAHSTFEYCGGLCQAMKKTDSPIAIPPKKRKGVTDFDTDVSQQPNTTALNYKSSTVNLKDWIGYQILAKDGPYYYPGTIHSVASATSIEVLFDRHPTTPQLYKDILDSNDILGNSSAPAILIKTGIHVCVKVQQNAYFTIGRVSQIRHGPPMQCLVQTSLPNPTTVWVNRALVRLLQPPWYDDLEDTGGQEVSWEYFEFSISALVLAQTCFYSSCRLLFQ